MLTMRILERSCVTNSAVDSLFLEERENKDSRQRRDDKLVEIATNYQTEVNGILNVLVTVSLNFLLLKNSSP